MTAPKPDIGKMATINDSNGQNKKVAKYSDLYVIRKYILIV